MYWFRCWHVHSHTQYKWVVQNTVTHSIQCITTGTRYRYSTVPCSIICTVKCYHSFKNILYTMVSLTAVQTVKLILLCVLIWLAYRKYPYHTHMYNLVCYFCRCLGRPDPSGRWTACLCCWSVRWIRWAMCRGNIKSPLLRSTRRSWIRSMKCWKRTKWEPNSRFWKELYIDALL